ncbi:MAG: hypothetical protein INR65_19265 [Gluconacetobacter diazotrophicus]|nr:hypothetical protein [Gluconacetobacter diazotrophicus]
MSEHDENGLRPKGEEGARLKQRITDDKRPDKDEPFDPGASMLGTDNEAGAPPDRDGMEQARNAPKPG